MNLVWFTWKDDKHPQAGGAEVVAHEIINRLVQAGHKVKLVTARYPGSTSYEKRPNGLEIYRAGNRFTVYPAARKINQTKLKNWADVVIDEMNTIPFVPQIHHPRQKRVLLNHQLARKVWFYQMPFPLSLIGYLSEPIMLRMICDKYDNKIAVSESTKHDLERHGFRDVQIIREAIYLQPLKKLLPKKDMNHVLAIGAVRPMKRTLHAVKAFEVAKDTNPKLHMTIAGDTSSAYAKKVLEYIANSRHKESIDVVGRVTNDERTRLMSEAAVILVSPIKEGWGLTVTEANSQGTPAIGYDVDGLRDSIKDNQTGLLCRDGDYTAMGELLNKLLDDKALYDKLRRNAWEWSREFNFDNTYSDFLEIII